MQQEIGKVSDYQTEVESFYKNNKSLGGITFTGSSTITGWNSLAQDFPSFTVRNHGIGGSTLRDIIAHSKKLIFFNKPEILVLYIGDNDAYAYSFDTYKRYMDLFVKNFQHRMPASFLVFISIKPSPSRSGQFPYYRQVNAYLKSLADSSSNFRFVDIWTTIENGGLKNYFLEDQLHLNRKGYEVLIEKLTPVLQSIYFEQLNE